MRQVGSIGPRGREAVQRAVAAVASGCPVVVLDDREDEGALIVGAELATPETLAFMIRYTSGFVCVALPGEDCERLALPPLHHRDDDRLATAYRVTVDLRGTGTGISAAARARTIAALASRSAGPKDFVRPGHVVPLRACDDGLLSRSGRTEAAVDLARLAGLRPAGALCEIVSEERPAEMARRPELARFAARHGLEMVSIAELAAFRRATELQVRRFAAAGSPTVLGGLQIVGYRGAHDGAEHVVLLAGDPSGAVDFPVQVHTECFAGDVLGSTACQCGVTMRSAVTEISTHGRGAVVYVRPSGGVRTCGLPEPAHAENTARSAEIAAAILRDLGVMTATAAGADPELEQVFNDYGLDTGPAGQRAAAG